MRISIWPSAGQPWSDILETARHAERTGWDGVWIADHFMPNAAPGRDPEGPTLEAGSLVAALGAAVPRVRIGTLVYGNTYRHPAVLANMAATVDHVTGGRFTLGVGAGWQLNEHEQYGIELPGVKQRLDRFVEALQVIHGLLRQPRATLAGWQLNEHEQYGIELPPVRQRLDRFVEALQVIHGLLRRPRTTLAGEYYQLTDAVCEPKPVQDALPIMIGGGGEKRMLGIVAEYADLWNTWGLPELIAHKSAVLDRFCAERGRDPKSIARTAQALVVVDGPLPEGLPVPAIGGSPARLADAIAEYRAAGLDELIVPDGFLGAGAAKLKAMDTVLELQTR